MSGFGKRQPVSAPLRPVPVARGDVGPSGQTPPFSFMGLAGAIIVSVVLTLLFVNPLLSQFKALIDANPDLAQSAKPGEIAFVIKFMRWALVVFYGLKAVGYCTVARLVAKFMKNDELWLFALVGLLSSALLYFMLARSFNGALTGFLPLGIHGVATTSTYWLIATWRAA